MRTRASDLKIPDVQAPMTAANVQPTEGGVVLVTEVATGHVAYTEVATGHVAYTDNGMFDGNTNQSRSGTIGTASAIGEVELNAKYDTHMLFSVRYSRNAYSSSDRRTGAREFSIEFMNASGEWQTYANVQVPNQTTHTDLDFSADPLPLPASRRLRFTMLRNWEDTTSVHWHEFALTMATYQT